MTWEFHWSRFHRYNLIFCLLEVFIAETNQFTRKQSVADSLRGSKQVCWRYSWLCIRHGNVDRTILSILYRWSFKMQQNCMQMICMFREKNSLRSFCKLLHSDFLRESNHKKQTATKTILIAFPTNSKIRYLPWKKKCYFKT